MSSKVFASEEGQGHPVVLISGLGGLGAFWKPVVDRLKAEYKIVTFDHPGVGQSDIQGLPTIPGIVDALMSVLNAKSIERAHLVGHSTGSLVAQSMALDHPERVQSIVLSSGWVKPDKRFQDFFGYRKYLLARLGGDAYSALTRLVAYPSQWYGTHLADDRPLTFDEPSSLDVGMTQARMDMLLGYTRKEELKNIFSPSLVVGASDDFVIPFHHSQELARLIPGSTLAELSGGHFAPVTRSDSYVALLKNFWESAR